MQTWTYAHICKKNIPIAVVSMACFLMIIVAMPIHQCSMLNSMDVQSHLVIAKIYLGHRYQAVLSFACVAEYISKAKFCISLVQDTFPPRGKKKTQTGKKKITKKPKPKKYSVVNEMKTVEFLKLFSPIWRNYAKNFLGGKKNNLRKHRFKVLSSIGWICIKFAFVLSLKRGAVGPRFS